MDDSAKNFVEEATKRGLSKDTTDALLKEDYDSTAALKLMDLERDLPLFKLDEVQEHLVKSWVKELNQSPNEIDVKNIDYKILPESPASVNLDAPKYKDKLMKNVSIIQDLSTQLKKVGLEELRAITVRHISEFKSMDVQVCVTGCSGAGKSRLIASLLQTDSPMNHGAHTDIIPYASTQFPEIKFWDFRGSQLESSDDEAMKEQLSAFDAMIICSYGRFSELDLKLAVTAKEHHMRLYYIRTKLDLDIENTKRDEGAEFDENTLMEKIKNDAKNNLARKDIVNAEVFTLSTLAEYRQQWEFPQLCKQLELNPPVKNVSKVIAGANAAAMDIIDEKHQKLSGRIPEFVDEIVKAEDNRKEVMRKICETCYNEYSTEQSFLDTGKSGEYQCFNTSFEFSKVEESTSYRWYGIIFLGIGFFIGLCIDKYITSQRRTEVNKVIRKESQDILTDGMDKLRVKARTHFVRILEEIKADEIKN